ncbi:MAG: hypothetical protein JKX97_02620 [Candidatus Lindowbacteria bacterium]|nr:hypothetical protein [Candidatus Lindowbacteria bacterium]
MNLPDLNRCALNRSVRVFLLALIVFSTACSSVSQKGHRIIPPEPDEISSVLFDENSTYITLVYGKDFKPDPNKKFQNFYENYTYRSSSVDRLVDKSLSKLASNVRSHRTGQAMVSRYNSGINKIESGFRSIEGALTSFGGIKKSEFRAGAGVTAGAAASTLGGLHLLKPQAVLGKIPGTNFTAQYDVGQIDDPKLILSKGDVLDFTLSKDGVAGALKRDNIIYYLNLDVSRQKATANMEFSEFFSLGSRISAKEEKVTGFVNIGL